MPRFFFHLRNDLSVDDEEGVDLADLASARSHAIANIRELACEAVRSGELVLGHKIEVADESGSRVLTITYADAILVK